MANKKFTKTYKLGEQSQGGVITIVINGKMIEVQGKEWDFSKGSNKTSDQSNAKIFRRDIVMADNLGSRYNLLDILNDLTTSYYADEICNWIESKVQLKTESRFGF